MNFSLNFSTQLLLFIVAEPASAQEGQIPIPPPPPNEILIKIKGNGIWYFDLKFWENYLPTTKQCKWFDVGLPPQTKFYILPPLNLFSGSAAAFHVKLKTLMFSLIAAKTQENIWKHEFCSWSGLEPLSQNTKLVFIFLQLLNNPRED